MQGSSRPFTSGRPTTAFDRDQFQQHLQQQQPREIEEEYEESDDEDVFAFLPPTTADQERESAFQSPFSFGNHVQYPEPTYDPWGRPYPPIPAAGAPSEYPFSMDPNTYTSPPFHATALPPGIPCQTYSQSYSQAPLPSPSTDSHPSSGMSGPDFYRLKRLGTAASSILDAVDDVKDMETEQNGDYTRKADDVGLNRDHTDKEGNDSDSVSSEEDGDIASGRRCSRHIAKSQDFQCATDPDQDTERDGGLSRQSLAAVAEGAVSGVRERGRKNPNALPYKMYNQQASSYYGRDVRTGSVSASGVGTVWRLIFSFPVISCGFQLLKTPDLQAVNLRLSHMVRILSPTGKHSLKHIINTSHTNIAG
jgi:hypothetical protein